MRLICLQRISKKRSFMLSASCSLAIGLFTFTSCGRLKFSSSNSGSTSSAPFPEITVIPPVPVTGSYLTSILLDEFSKPIAQADVSADAGQFTGRTNDKGIISLPVRLVKDSAVELDIKIKGQTLFVTVLLPPDIVDAVRAVDPLAGTEAARTLGVRIADSQSLPTSAPGNRTAVETLSLPVQIVQALATNTPVPAIAITSHKNGDVVQNLVNLTGTCDAGTAIRVTGDLVVTLDTACLNSGSQGNFNATVNLTHPDGLKSLTVTQTQQSTGEYVSQLLLLSSRNPPLAPGLAPSQVAGLKPMLIGRCDSSATSHTATTTVGSVRSVKCTDGVLNVEMGLPIGTTAFSVTATSTNSLGSVNSGVVSFTSASTTCPTGYIRVPASKTPGLGSVNASNGHAQWWLDTSLDFCLMKYPAKDNNGSTYASSTMTGTPWVTIPRGTDESSPGGAMKACKDAGPGYRLISNTQWQSVARNIENVAANWSGNVVGGGVLARGHSDNSPANALDNNAADTDGYSGTGNSATQAVGSGWEQRRTQTLSNGDVVWDFGGNVYQWVSDNHANLGVNPATSAGFILGFHQANWFPTTGDFAFINRLLFAPLGSYDTTKNTGAIEGGSAGAVVRGGLWSDGSVAGAFSTFLNAPATESSIYVGFRCVYLP
jgi:hypothetical protein